MHAHGQCAQQLDCPGAASDATTHLGTRHRTTHTRPRRHLHAFPFSSVRSVPYPRVDLLFVSSRRRHKIEQYRSNRSLYPPHAHTRAPSTDRARTACNHRRTCYSPTRVVFPHSTSRSSHLRGSIRWRDSNMPEPQQQLLKPTDSRSCYRASRGRQRFSSQLVQSAGG